MTRFATKSPCSGNRPLNRLPHVLRVAREDLHEAARFAILRGHEIREADDAAPSSASCLSVSPRDDHTAGAIRQGSPCAPRSATRSAIPAD
ncbi:hypothetical protein BURPS1710b_A1763 [Burkholderia pseudomallei 1710b]|uniref:Uncharacterized protein n=1 Tax=Burkholderia pseudomallei (strain 1710b) TaxID=320372 RepID=Q3JHN2_BURP1|nr:hypothetical protein BURPS1710b_A1763 [Burkholderia pseudomallei 1710b]